MSVKIYLIGAAYRTDRLAGKLGEMIGVKPFLADGKYDSKKSLSVRLSICVLWNRMREIKLTSVLFPLPV